MSGDDDKKKNTRHDYFGHHDLKWLFNKYRNMFDLLHIKNKCDIFLNIFLLNFPLNI